MRAICQDWDITDEWKELKKAKRPKAKMIIKEWKDELKSSLCIDLITETPWGKSPLGDSIPEKLPSNISSYTRMTLIEARNSFLFSPSQYFCPKCGTHAQNKTRHLFSTLCSKAQKERQNTLITKVKQLTAHPWTDINEYDTFTQIALLTSLARVEGQTLSEEALELTADYLAGEEP
jgi:hypothetical protein